jgi:hypothetical protein
MTTQNTEERAQDTEDFGPVPATDTPEGRKEFKERASKVLQAGCESEGLCATADQILAEVGLQPRPNYVRQMVEDARYRAQRSIDRYSNNPYVKVEVVTPELVGEDTDEAFNAWRAATGKRLHEEADHHGYGRAVPVIVEAGFPAPVETEVVVEGTFRLTRPVKRFGDENLIDAIEDWQIRDQLFERFNTDDVQWKATLANEGS